MNQRLEEVMQRIGSRPALIHMQFAGDAYPDDRPYEIRDGIACIDIVGPLSNAAWSWRGTTYGEIQMQVKTAQMDPAVKGILLYVNSPGGETDNAFETAQVIAAAAEEKPCYAVASTMAYSAGYLLASQANRIYCSPISGGVGSVGVYCAHMDMSEALKQAGVKVTLVSAGKGKTDGNPYEPLSASAEAQMQEEIDRLYGQFVAAVATGRGMRESEVVKLGARMYDGKEKAIASGLANLPGDISVAFADLVAQTQKQAINFSSSVASATGKGAVATMPEDTKPGQAEAKVPTSAEIEAMVSQAAQTGRAEAALIANMCAIAGHPELIGGFLGANKTSAQVSTELLAAKVAADQKSAIDPSVMPGLDASVDTTKTYGQAKPWSEIMAKFSGRKGAK
jgi:signal peptide peptidase SppA